MRCQCLTLEKKVCSRQAEPGSNYCYQHLHCKSPKKSPKRRFPKLPLSPKTLSAKKDSPEELLSPSMLLSPETLVNLSKEHTKTLSNQDLVNLSKEKTVNRDLFLSTNSSIKNDLVLSNSGKSKRLETELMKLIFDAEPVQHDKAESKARSYSKYVSSKPGLQASEQLYKPVGIVEPKRIIGQGTYGCVTLPSIPCAGFLEHEYKGLVSKVLNETEAEKEIKESIALKRIDTLVSGIANTTSARYKYGVYALDKCAFPLYDLKEVESFDDAENGPCQAGDARSLGFVLHMEKADADCSQLGSIYTKEVHSSNIGHWVKALKNALLGLANMHKNRIYHFDVKPANMLYFYNHLEDRPITIKLNDFGMTSSSLNPHFKESIPFRVPWFNFPPLASIISNILIYETLDKNEAKFRADYWATAAYYNLNRHIISCIDPKIYQEPEINRALAEWNGSKKADDAAVHDIASRIDLYGFAYTLDKLYRHMNVDQKSLVSTFCKNITEMKLSTETAIEEYDKILALF